MKTRISILGSIVLFALGMFGPSALRGASDQRPSPKPSTPGGSRVFVLPLKGPIDKAMLYVFRRAFREVEREKPDAIVIDLDTPGGRLQETNEIVNWMRSVKKDTKIFAFVNPNALSAGAMISLGTDAIYMSPSSSIGSAMPIAISPLGGGVQELSGDVKEKMLSAVRAMVRSLAQENGYSVDIAEAMVDAEKEIRIGDQIICAKGELLNFTGKEAVRIIPPRTKPLLATAVVEDLQALLDHAGYADATVTRFEEQGVERLARWITSLGPLLLALGVLGLYIEFKTPGFGLPGIAGLTLLAIYFFGHYVAGLAGNVDIFLVVLGIGLLATEVFVIPGFGIVGMLGILCLFSGCLMALIPYIPDVSPLPGVPEFTPAALLDGALLQFSTSIVLVVLGAWITGIVLPKTSIYRDAVLTGGLSRERGYVASDAARYMRYLNREGLAWTALRPAGTAVFGDERLDVVSSGDLIERNAKIRVIEVEGSRVVVEAVPREKPPPEEPAEKQAGTAPA